jgi:hypothetical protein
MLEARHFHLEVPPRSRVRLGCPAFTDLRRSGKPGVPVGLHEATIRIPSLL